MAIHFVPVAAGLAGAALLAFLVMGSSHAVKVPTPGPKPSGKSPAQLGTDDGCARGTADAKAGKSAAQAALDLNTGDGAATLIAAADASGDRAAYLAAFGLAHAECFSKNAPPPVTKTMPAKYKVGSGETPASIASKFGVTVDYLLTALNGYGHGENGTKDNAPYPYGGDLHAFTSTFSGLGSGGFPPVGTTFAPTWQAGHQATANLRPIFRSSAPSSSGQRYWWFPAGAGPAAVPMPYTPNNSGFGLIYSNGGLFLVGPWYAGMTLNVPGKPGDTSAGEGDVATSGVVVGALNSMVRAVTGRTFVGAVRLAPRAVRAPTATLAMAQRDAVVRCYRIARAGTTPTGDVRGAAIMGRCAWGVLYGTRPTDAQAAHVAQEIDNRYAMFYTGSGDLEQNLAAIALAVVGTYAAHAPGGAVTAGARRPTSHPLGWPAPPR